MEAWDTRTHAHVLRRSICVPKYLGQDWFQHSGSGEVGLNAGLAQHMLASMTLVAMHSKDDVRDLELVYGAPHFQSMSFERYLHRSDVVRVQ